MTRVAFRALDGTLLPGVYHHRPLPVYDVTTGTVSAPGPALYDVQVLVSQYSREEVDGVRVLATDRKLCVRQAPPEAEPPGLPVTPTLRDRLDVQGTFWNIMALSQDAAGLTWVFQGRAEGEGA